MLHLRFSLIALAVLAEYGLAQNQPVSFCFPNTPGVLNCPCNNPPQNPGSQGCNNFGSNQGTGGAYLFGSGQSSIANDTLNFQAGSENSHGFTTLLESRNATFGGVLYGAGVRCVLGPIHRVYGHNGFRQADGSGYVFWGPNIDPQISTDIGAQVGETTFFQAWYRDPNAITPCQNVNLNFNTTNAVSVTWF